MAPKPTEEHHVRLSIRLPLGLHRLMETEAQKNERSISSEIVWRLRRSLRPKK